MSAQVHTFIHHDGHIHHPSLHHPHPHHIHTRPQREQLSGWNGLLWTDYLNGFGVARDLLAEQDEIEMLEDSSEEEMLAEQEEPVKQGEVKQEEHDYCTLHEHPARPLSPPLMPRPQTDSKKRSFSEISEDDAGISHYEDWMEAAVQHDYCTLHEHPARPLSPPLLPRTQPIQHDYCTLHSHPERPLSPPLFHRSPALKGSETPELRPTSSISEDDAGISHYEDWMDEFALDRAVADLRELDIAEHAPVPNLKSKPSVHEFEIEEDIWSDAPETPDSEQEAIFDEPESLVEDFGFAAGSYNRRCSTTEDIEEACCSCTNEHCSAAFLARDAAKDLRTRGLRLHPIFGDIDGAARVPRGAW